jgi:hypothetical protein
MSAAALDIPPLRDLLRGAAPRLIEAVVIPTLLFVTLLSVGGVQWAIIGAFAWAAAVIGVRVALRRRVPTIVFLGLGLLALRTVLAVAAQSSFVYFLQPTLGTAAVGMAFLASAVAGRPLVLRLARDFCPVPDDVMAHGHFRRFFMGLSVLWGSVQLVNAAVTLWLLLSQSLGTFVVMRTTFTHTVTATAIAISVLWFRRVRSALEPSALTIAA